jgi:hypothetical protein
MQPNATNLIGRGVRGMTKATCEHDGSASHKRAEDRREEEDREEGVTEHSVGRGRSGAARKNRALTDHDY